MKLTLSKETLRTLSSKESAEVAGGLTGFSNCQTHCPICIQWQPDFSVAWEVCTA
jgi:hypothetical protein